MADFRGFELVLTEEEEDLLRSQVTTRGLSQGFQDDFCRVWPQAKGGLELLRNVLNVIPSVGPFVGIAIGVVIGAGETASKVLCERG